MRQFLQHVSIACYAKRFISIDVKNIFYVFLYMFKKHVFMFLCFFNVFVLFYCCVFVVVKT